MPPLITLFVACYNESGNIEGTLDVIRAACAEAGITYEVIIIDDASTDGSPEIIRRYMDAHPEMPIHLHVNEKNMGFGENFGEAAFLGTGTYYRVVCGDNVEPVETLVKVFREIGKADIILSYRPNDVEGKALSRRLLSKSTPSSSTRSAAIVFTTTTASPSSSDVMSCDGIRIPTASAFKQTWLRVFLTGEQHISKFRSPDKSAKLVRRKPFGSIISAPLVIRS